MLEPVAAQDWENKRNRAYEDCVLSGRNGIPLVIVPLPVVEECSIEVDDV